MSKPMLVALSGSMLLGLAASPAMADNFSFGFAYDDGYGRECAPVYGHCAPTVVVVDRPAYYCPPPRPVYRSAYYGDCYSYQRPAYRHYDRPRYISGGSYREPGFGRGGYFQYQGRNRSFGFGGFEGQRGHRGGGFYYGRR